HPRHVAKHDVIPAFGHDRQLVAALVGPHAESEEADAALLADRLDLLEMAARLGAGLVQVIERSAGQLKLPRGLEADRAIVAAHRDDMAVLLDRLPAELAQFQQDVANAAGLGIGGSGMGVATIDELFVLGADPPPAGRFLPLLQRRDELFTPLDRPFLTV